MPSLFRLPVTRSGLAVLSLALLLVACDPGPGPRFTVTNRTGTALTDLIISGSGFRHRIQRLAPHTSMTFEVHPSGESGVAVAFTSGGHRTVLPETDYFEGNPQYSVAVNIVPGPRVSVSVSISKHTGQH